MHRLDAAADLQQHIVAQGCTRGIVIVCEIIQRRAGAGVSGQPVGRSSQGFRQKARPCAGDSMPEEPEPR